MPFSYLKLDHSHTIGFQEDAFWCLVAVVEKLLPKSYYNHTMMAAQADQRVLTGSRLIISFRLSLTCCVELVAERLPKLHQHLETHTVDLTLITFNWYLSIIFACFNHLIDYSHQAADHLRGLRAG